MRTRWNVAGDRLAEAMDQINAVARELRNKDGGQSPPEYYGANRLWLQAEELLRALRDRAAAEAPQ